MHQHKKISYIYALLQRLAIYHQPRIRTRSTEHREIASSYIYTRAQHGREEGDCFGACVRGVESILNNSLAGPRKYTGTAASCRELVLFLSLGATSLGSTFLKRTSAESILSGLISIYFSVCTCLWFSHFSLYSVLYRSTVFVHPDSERFFLFAALIISHCFIYIYALEKRSFVTLMFYIYITFDHHFTFSEFSFFLYTSQLKHTRDGSRRRRNNSCAQRKRGPDPEDERRGSWAHVSWVDGKKALRREAAKITPGKLAESREQKCKSLIFLPSEARVILLVIVVAVLIWIFWEFCV